MTLSCPQCDFVREVEDAQVPPKAVRAICPRCGQKFPLAKAAPESDSSRRPCAEAGFVLRLISWCLDAVLLSAVQLLGSLLFGAAAYGIYGIRYGISTELILPLSLLFWLTVGQAYAIFFTGYCGQTPGKMALRLRVEGADGTPLGFRRAALRETLGRLGAALPFGAGYLMVVFDENKQGLHDKLAGSRVVKL